jgi:hypothetical protein
LDGDLGSIDTSFHCLSDREPYYDFKVSKAELAQNKSGGQMVKFDYETIAPSTSIEGKPLGPGIHCFDNLNLAPSGKATWEIVLRNAATIVKAFGMVKEKGFNWSQYGATPQDQMRSANLWLPQTLGKVFRAKVGYEPAGVRDGKPQRARNIIVAYIPAS